LFFWFVEVLSLFRMALPPVPVADVKLGVAFRERLVELGVNRESIRERTERGDNLRAPLKSTRRAALEDEPLNVAVRFLFCGSSESPIDLEHTLGSDLFLAAVVAGLVVPVTDQKWGMPFHLRPVVSWVPVKLPVSCLRRAFGRAVSQIEFSTWGAGPEAWRSYWRVPVKQ
jgi:hypothetical protein